MKADFVVFVKFLKIIYNIKTKTRIRALVVKRISRLPSKQLVEVRFLPRAPVRKAKELTKNIDSNHIFGKRKFFHKIV